MSIFSRRSWGLSSSAASGVEDPAFAYLNSSKPGGIIGDGRFCCRGEKCGESSFLGSDMYLRRVL